MQVERTNDEPLPQFALFDEEEERTVRRNFAPKSPARVAVEVSDADKTWKWTRARADSQGRFVALALPTLEDERAIEWSREDVEATLERPTPFALTVSAASDTAIPLLAKRKTPPPPPRPVESTAELMAIIGPPRKFPWGLALAALGVFVFAVTFAIGMRVRSSEPVVVPSHAAAAKPSPVVETPSETPAPATGTVAAPAWASGRRVYVDGKVVGETPHKIEVACGKHVVKIGSAGHPRDVEVPCGGELVVVP